MKDQGGLGVGEGREKGGQGVGEGRGRGLRGGGARCWIKGVWVWVRATGAYTCVCSVVSPLAACRVREVAARTARARGARLGTVCCGWRERASATWFLVPCR